jgi:hypothetical protein
VADGAMLAAPGIRFCNGSGPLNGGAILLV